MKPVALAGRVVVVVGASSGIGRATALAFAEHGCRLCVVARRAEALEDVARECRARGAEVVIAAADSSNPADMDRVGRTVLDAYGVVDVWVHMAAGLIAGRFGDEPLDEVRHLVEVDILGYVHGARTALDIFRRQGHGTLVNIGSVLGEVPNPLVPTYVMAKFAITGLTRSLMRLTDGDRDIHVGLVRPGPMDTPLFARAANHTGHQLRAIPPACAPERAAAAIVSCARRPGREVTVGLTGRVVVGARRVAPVLTDRAVAAWAGRLLVRRHVPAASTAGALFEGEPTGRIHGGWRRSRTRRVLGERLGRALARRGVAVDGPETAEGPE